MQGEKIYKIMKHLASDSRTNRICNNSISCWFVCINKSRSAALETNGRFPLAVFILLLFVLKSALSLPGKCTVISPFYFSPKREFKFIIQMKGTKKRRRGWHRKEPRDPTSLMWNKRRHRKNSANLKAWFVRIN